MNPKVFISHASEDKDRFVLGFAGGLRKSGVDAWVDKWEMGPGDSLVNKIFEEGIKEAAAFVIVLSNVSVNKPWVREELNVAVINRMAGLTKIIPVLIDDCEVPEVLKSTLWVKVSDLKDYSNELNSILKAIFGYSEKPELGSLPAYAKTVIDTIPGLNKTDSIVLKLVCDLAVETGHPLIVDISRLIEMAQSFDIDESSLIKSIDILSRKFFVETDDYIGDYLSSVVITLAGFDQYARLYLSDYELIVESVIAQIVNHDNVSGKKVAENLKLPNMVVRHVFKILESQNYADFDETIGDFEVYNLSPELERLLQ